MNPADEFAAVRIVLVEPAGPLNVGAIARVMKNFGLSQLVLVNPQCDPRSDEARQMAVHAPELLETAQIVPDIPTALTGCQRAIATTGRPRTLATQLEHPREALPWLVSDRAPSALIFGPEDRGLNNQELNYAQRFIYIPTNPAYPSLNLAQAVAICGYELFQLRERDRKHPDRPIAQPLPDLAAPAPLESLEAYYQHLEAVLLQIGYLYPHTANSRMQKFRRLFSRSLPTETEVALLRGILSQVEWAVKQKPNNH